MLVSTYVLPQYVVQTVLDKTSSGGGGGICISISRNET